MRKIEVEIIATVGDEVYVENYRTKDKTWEAGVVSNVEIGVSKDYTTKVGYTVRLHRKTYAKHGPSWGRPISLFARQDKIRLRSDWHP